MIAYFKRTPLGPLRTRWEFATEPLVFYVLYYPRRDRIDLAKDEDTPENMQRFFDEQLAKVRAYLQEHPKSEAQH